LAKGSQVTALKLPAARIKQLFRGGWHLGFYCIQTNYVEQPRIKPVLPANRIFEQP
jgi:hypothetical protein